MRKLILLLALAAGAVLAAGCSPSPEAVKRTLNEHPELLMEVLDAHKAELADMVLAGMAEKREKEKAAKIQAELEHPLVPVVEPDRPVLGDPKAPVLIVEYSDFLCPHCSRASATVEELMAKHPGMARLVFKHFPLHEGSAEAAVAFETLARQDPALAWRFKTALFKRQDEFAGKGVPFLTDLARELGADMERFALGLKDKTILDRILADIKEAESFGFKGTPMFVVGGVTITGAAPLDEFERTLLLVKQHQDEKDCKTCVDAADKADKLGAAAGAPAK
ncbi:MAG: DsbA family protein [Desulfovibrionaceae bacterium]